MEFVEFTTPSSFTLLVCDSVEMSREQRHVSELIGILNELS